MREKEFKRNLTSSYKAGLYDGRQFVNNIPKEHKIEIMILVDGEPIEPGHYLEDIMESFTQYSEWSGHYLPTFREWSGYTDPMNVGTFQEGGEEEDHNFSEIMDRYNAGQIDGFLTGLIERVKKETTEWMKIK